MDLPSPIPTVAPVATALPVQQPISTLSPSNVLSPTAAPTFRPSGESIEMCSDNIPVTVTLGPRSNPSGSFVNLPTQQSLENVVDCLDIDQGEQHTQSSHVWWNPGPIELIFEFNDVEYNIRDVYFWNYFGKTYDVDEIELTFFNANGELTGQETIRPRLGENASGQNANNIVAEVLTLSSVYTASRMTALLRSDNGQIDFQNFVVRAA